MCDLLGFIHAQLLKLRLLLLLLLLLLISPSWPHQRVPLLRCIRAAFFPGCNFCRVWISSSSMSKAATVAKPGAVAALPPGQQVLGGKEASNFKEVNRLYECRDFKRALRLCDDILKKVPEHGETMALKALCLHGSGKKEDGMEMSRRALKANMKSQVTWHVLGTMHRGDMNHRQGRSLALFSFNSNV